METGAGCFFRGKGDRHLFLKVRREFMGFGEKGASTRLDRYRHLFLMDSVRICRIWRKGTGEMGTGTFFLTIGGD
jgi:hypothetical protein